MAYDDGMILTSRARHQPAGLHRTWPQGLVYDPNRLLLRVKSQRLLGFDITAGDAEETDALRIDNRVDVAGEQG